MGLLQLYQDQTLFSSVYFMHNCMHKKQNSYEWMDEILLHGYGRLLLGFLSSPQPTLWALAAMPKTWRMGAWK